MRTFRPSTRLSCDRDFESVRVIMVALIDVVHRTFPKSILEWLLPYDDFVQLVQSQPSKKDNNEAGGNMNSCSSAVIYAGIMKKHRGGEVIQIDAGSILATAAEFSAGPVKLSKNLVSLSPSKILRKVSLYI